MGRYVVVIRKPDNPVSYYLSKRGLRCYDHRNVAVFRKLSDALEEREHFAGLMRDFRLTVEKLPPRLPVAKGLLSAQPVETV
jgi:hypothetical protein